MNIYLFISTVIALVCYLPLCIQIYKGTSEQNLATWILWGLLDVVISVSVILQDGNYLLPVAYTVGNFITVAFIVRTKKVSWTWFETSISTLVVVCIVVWVLVGSRGATIASTVAMTLAGFPQMVETWRKPKSSPSLIYCGYFTANVFSLIGAKAWTVEDRLYPFYAVLFCAIIVLIGTRRRNS